MWDARLRARKGRVYVDGVHEIVALLRRRERAGEADGACVVDEDVDAAKRCHGLRHGRGDPSLVADVDGAWKRLATGSLDFLGARVDGAGERRVWLPRFRDHNGITPHLRAAERHRLSHAPTCATDQKGVP